MKSIVLLSLVLLGFAYYVNPLEITHLVTMRKAEFMEIVDCVSKSHDITVCEKFLECEKLMPKQVSIITEKCKNKCMVGGMKKCSLHEPLYESLDVPMKIFDCILENIHKMSAEENKKMVEFEVCIRNLHAMSCKFPRHHEDFLIR